MRSNDKVHLPVTEKCHRCGAPLNAAELDGLCARCLALDFFNPEVAGTAGEAEPTPAIPRLLPATRMGDYELIELIARGGMGLVYKARQTSLDRIVALKTIAGGLLVGDEALERFRIEAMAAGGLQHPNIVAIHEVGEHDGQHYFSMDYVAGPTLGDLVREGPLPGKRAARYLRQVALALHYAHGRGVLHRDLKPSNVLIDEHDQPRVTDFGLAKRLGDDLLRTRSEAIIGTPAFIAPEQVDRQFGSWGVRSDIYGLGAILYYIITGRVPFVGQSVPEILSQILHVEPIPPRLLNPAVPPDLETIVLKCLEKEPARRYATAQDLADELDRFLSGQPIQARPITGAERFFRWCKRKPAHAVSLSLLAVLAIGSLTAAFQINKAWQASEQNRRQAEANLYAADMNLALEALESENTARAMELLLKHLPKPGEADLRSFEWRYLWRQARGDHTSTLGFHSDPVRQVLFSPDGRTVASRSMNGTAKVWPLNTSSLRPLVSPTPEPLMLTDVFLLGGFSPDGKTLAVGTADETAQLVEISTGRRTTVLTNAGLLVRLLNDGKTMATTGTNFLLKLWDLDTGKLKRTLPGGGGGGHWRGAPWDLSVAITPDGATLASIDKETEAWFVVKIWDVASGRLLAQSPRAKHDIDSLQLSDDGRYAAFGFSWTGSFALWDWTVPREPTIIFGHLSGVKTLAFSTDGQFLVTGASDQLLKVWSVPDGSLQIRFKVRDTSIWSAAFSPDGNALVAAGQDGLIRVWATERPPSDLIAGLPNPRAEGDQPARITFSRDSEFLTFACSSNHVPIFDLKSLRMVAAISNVACILRFSEDGNQALCVGSDSRSPGNRLMIWERRTGALSATPVSDQSPLTGSTIQPSNDPTGLDLFNAEISSDLSLAAVPMHGGSLVQLLDLARGRALKTLEAHDGPITDLTFSRDMSKLVTAGSDGLAKLWEVPSGKLLAIFTNHTDGVLDADCSRDGNVIATSSFDKTIRLWDVKTKRQTGLLRGHRQPALSVAFSPDGKLLASGSSDATVKLWSVPFRQELATFELAAGNAVEPGKAVHGIAFSPDNSTLVARTADGTIRVWRAARWEEIAQEEGLFLGHNVGSVLGPD